MSLDVCLSGEYRTEKCTCRECGNEHEKQVSENLFQANITHNLGLMAIEAGIYTALWRPEEITATPKAKDIIELIRDGLNKMKAKPEYYKGFNAENGWGTYDQFIPWIEEYLNACIENPEAYVTASR